ncbi:tRNA(Ile)-lysidine synthetase [Paenibacillus stellifer]|uniref:tRNA(Ile)-lysidine synthase n=1 Tax=Paenibacillus stellifer TaxID=169760 RepID=A0A089LNY4_9BACL|nr:tRNA lysidine(34) synthetase TilS [Paenibacillus stellifer]AIQ61805.1 tRNA(Ile)-lysidine synthetase [Paenibacillus stellifer]
MKWNELVDSVMDAAAEYKLWSAGDAIVVAVSGGPDSVALLHVLNEISRTRMPLSLICAHVNHGFRAESKMEAELVRDLAERLEVPFELAEFDIPAYMKESGLGPQEAARNKRYRFLIDTAHRHGAAAVALAHHADDQAETVLMHLLRGSGLSGLAGMRWKRTERKMELVRPLLRMNKASLVEACRERGFRYAEDASNAQVKYKRNAVRLEVLPFLAEFNPSLSRSLTQLAEIAGAEDDYMEEAAARSFADIVRKERGKCTLESAGFAALPSALQRRLIKLILNYLSADTPEIDFPKVEAVRRGILQERTASWRLDLGGGLTCIRQYHTVCFLSSPPDGQASYSYMLSSPASRLELREINKVLTMTALERAKGLDYSGSGGRAKAWFDLDQLVFPLTIRSRLPGDTIRIMGLNGSKKVKDIYIDDKIPSAGRSRIPIVCDGHGEIIWIPGIRRSFHAAVGQDTVSVLLLSLEDLAPE